MTSRLPLVKLNNAAAERRLKCCSCGEKYEVVGTSQHPEDGLTYEVVELDSKEHGDIPAFLTHESGEPHLAVDPELKCLPCYEWVPR